VQAGVPYRRWQGIPFHPLPERARGLDSCTRRYCAGHLGGWVSANRDADSAALELSRKPCAWRWAPSLDPLPSGPLAPDPVTL